MTDRSFRILIIALFCLVSTLTLFMLAAGGATASTPDGEGIAPPPAPAWAWAKNWQPCASDSYQPTRCVWNARAMGNRRGNSYIQTKRGHVIYITHRDAAALLRPIVY